MVNEALRLLRVFHDLSQTDLAQRLDLSNSYLSEIENGKKQPTLDLLQRYANYFEIPVSSLLFFSEQLEKKNRTDNLRMGLARKVVTLLNWVIEKDDSPKSGKKKAA